MKTEKDPFDSPDIIQLKGEVTGVTRLSGKAKLLVLLLGLGILSFIIFSIFTIDSASSASDTRSDEQKIEDTATASIRTEAAKPDVAIKGAGDGQAFLANSQNNTSGSTSSTYNFDLNSKDKGTTESPNKTVTVPEVKVPTQPTAHGEISPEVLAAQRIEEQKQQKHEMALQAELEAANFIETAPVALDASNKEGKSSAKNTYVLDQLNQALASAKGAQDDPNKQIRKESFIKEAELAQFNQTYLKQIKQAPLSPYEIKAGWVIPAVLECGINSDLPGQICARVRENVYDTKTGKYLLIPQGSKLIGTYDNQVAIGQERILLVWNRLIFPDGSSLTLQGMPGSNQAGYAGFDADVDNHYLKIFGSALMMSIISAGVQLSQPQQSATPNGAVSTQQTMAASLGQQLGQVSGALIQRNMQVSPTLKQKPGYKFNVLITKDIVLPGEYKD
jgi:type IV secretory pathway VirB10-like protein